MISVLSPCVVVRSAFSCSCFPGVQALGVRCFFFIFRTLEPSSFASFRGSSYCIFRAFGVSGFWFSWVSRFWPSGFRVCDACFPACQLSGFLPFMFSSFRLSFFDLSPELSIVCSKFAFVSCGSLLFAVLRVFPETPNNHFYPCNNRFTRATTIFSHANDHFRNCSVYVCFC